MSARWDYIKRATKIYCIVIIALLNVTLITVLLTFWLAPKSRLADYFHSIQQIRSTKPATNK